MKEIDAKVIVNKANRPQSSQGSKPINLLRRRTLLGSASGAAIVAWHQPIIKSIILPSHAQTSTEATPFFGANVSANPLASATSLLDMLIPKAAAGINTIPEEYAISVVPIGTDGAAFTISLFEDLGETQGFTLAQVVYSGEVSVESGGALSPTDNPCNLSDLVDIDVVITSVTADAVGLDFTNRAQSVSVPAGEGELPVPMCTDGPEPRSFKVENFGEDLLAQSSNKSLLNALISQAHAQEERPSTTTYTILAEETAGGSDRFTISLLESIDNPDSQFYGLVESTFSGTMDGPGSGTLALQTAGCDDAPMNAINASIDSVSDTELVMTLSSRELSGITLTPGTITIPPPSCEELPKADSYFQEGQGEIENGASEGNLNPPPASAFGISAIRIGSTNEYTVELLNPRGTLLRSAILNIDGTQKELMPVDANSPCVANQNPSASIGFINETEMELSITTGSNTGNAVVTAFVPAASGTLTAVCSPQ